MSRSGNPHVVEYGNLEFLDLGLLLPDLFKAHLFGNLA